MNPIVIPTPEEDFQYFVKEPKQWLMKGQTLYWAAMHLFKRYKEAMASESDGVPLDDVALYHVAKQFFEPAGMLAGFSLEVTIKAAIVANHPYRITRHMRGTDWTKKLGISPHDLMGLARAAEIEPGFVEAHINLGAAAQRPTIDGADGRFVASLDAPEQAMNGLGEFQKMRQSPA